MRTGHCPRSRLRALALALAAAGLLCNMSGCVSSEAQAQDAPAEAPVWKLRAVLKDADTKRGIAKAPVILDEAIIGFTDKDGLFEAEMSMEPYTNVVFGFVPIEGYRFADDTFAQHKTFELSKAGAPLPIDIEVEATSQRKDYLVWVAAKCGEGLEGKCGNLPVKRGDAVVAHTDAMGRAHFTMREVPGTKVTVAIDTPDDAEGLSFAPADPSKEIELGNESEAQVFLVDAAFANAAQPAKRVKRRSRRRGRSSRMRRVRSKPRRTTKKPSRTKPTRNKPKNDNGVIDLF